MGDGEVAAWGLTLLGSRVLPSGPELLHRTQEGPELGPKQFTVGDQQKAELDLLEDQPVHLSHDNHSDVYCDSTRHSVSTPCPMTSGKDA